MQMQEEVAPQEVFPYILDQKAERACPLGSSIRIEILRDGD